MKRTLCNSRQQFSCGTISTEFTIETDSAPINNALLDSAHVLFKELIDSEVMAQASKLADGYGGHPKEYSQAKQTSSFTVNGVTISATVRLTVRKADIEHKLNEILAHGLVHLHQLPLHVAEIIEEDRLKATTLDDPLFGDAFLDSLFSGLGPNVTVLGFGRRPVSHD